MPFNLTQKDMAKLTGVNPSMTRIIKRAALSDDFDDGFYFTVIFGLRTREEQFALWRSSHNLDGTPIKGKVWRTDKNGTPKGYTTPEGAQGTGLSLHQGGNAVDLGIIYDGHLILEGDVEKHYRILNDIIQHIAASLLTPVEWGGNWKKLDLMHFQLKQKEK